MWWLLGYILGMILFAIFTGWSVKKEKIETKKIEYFGIAISVIIFLWPLSLLFVITSVAYGFGKWLIK